MADYAQGARGEAVKIIQRALGGISVDGIYGAQTTNAIRAFQQAHGLPVTGVADKATQNALGIGVTDSGGGGVNDQIIAKLRSQYPQLAWAVNVPELAPIIAQIDTMEPAEFQAAIYNSSWYKTNQSSIREAEAQRNVDPATWNARVDQQAAHVYNIAAGMGLSAADARQVAEQSIRFGWSEEQLRTAISASAAEWHTGSQPTGAGSLYSVREQVQQMGDQWGIKISDAAAWEWSKRINAGSMSIEDMTPYFQEQAKSLYPSITKAIESGVSVQQYFDPYAQIAVQELGLNPADVKFSDPKWMRALVSFDKDGNRVPLTMDQWRSVIRNDPTYGWDNTAAAREQAAEFSSRTLQRMGLI